MEQLEDVLARDLPSDLVRLTKCTGTQCHVPDMKVYYTMGSEHVTKVKSPRMASFRP